MMKLNRSAVLAALLALVAASAALAAPASFAANAGRTREHPVFHSRADVAADAAWRLGSLSKATAPSGNNTLTYEGNVALTYLSGAWGAILMDVAEVRFECDNSAYALGCSATTSGDHLIIYGHLRTYLSCRHDGADDEVAVNLVYKRVVYACGDLTCTSWVLLTQ